MQTTGRGSNEREGHDASNVVQFPRGWIGPPEALVPFGPAADRDDAARDAPFGPDAFWTEEAASLHEAIEAPVAPEPPAPGPALTTGAVEPTVAGRRQPHWRVAALGLSVLFVLAVALVLTRGQHAGTARLAASVGKTAPAHSSSAAGPSILGARETSRLVRHTLPRRPERSALRHARARSHHPRASRGRSPVVHSSPVQTGVSYASGTVGGGETAGGPSTVYSAPPQSTQTTSSTPAASSGSTSKPNGPSGPGSAFGPGTMGAAKG